MRIGLLIESDGPGGAEAVVLQLARSLTRRGHDVSVLILAPGQGWLSGQLRKSGFSVYMPRLKRSVDPSFAKTLADWREEHRLDVLHAHEFTLGFYTGAASVISPFPFIITMHGGTSFAGALRRRLALRWAFSRASAVVGVSDSTCEHLARSLSLPKSRVSLVSNGVAIPGGDARGVRTSLGIPDQCALILSVGNLYPVKGHRVLLEACALLLRDRTLPPWAAAIAGRGEEEAHLRAKITELGLERHVRLLGLRSDIDDLLAASSVWVMPSLSEGTPMALLEAMLAGVPIVASAVGGIPAVIQNGISGWLVPPSDPERLASAIAEALNQPEIAARFAKRARDVALAEYTVTTMTDRYEHLYRAAIVG